MAKFRTHYDNLKVARNAPDAVIRAAYKALMQKYHPDKYDGDPKEAERIAKIIQASFNFLSDPVKRAEHDEWIRQQERKVKEEQEFQDVDDDAPAPDHQTQNEYPPASQNTPSTSSKNATATNAFFNARNIYWLGGTSIIASIFTGTVFLLFAGIALIVYGKTQANKDASNDSYYDVAYGKNSMEGMGSSSGIAIEAIKKIIYTALILWVVVAALEVIPKDSSMQSVSSKQPTSGSTTQTETPKDLFDQPQQPIPQNGEGISYFSNGIAPLTIKTTNDGYHYFVKIVDWYSHKPAGAYFIRSGYSLNMDLPIGAYELRYASGKIWYGERYLFGPETIYSKADKKLEFLDTGYQVSGYTVELYRQINGNLHTSKLLPVEW